MNPYLNLASAIARLNREARQYPLGSFPPCAAAPRTDAPLALLFSPHPDDESIVGGLALRLARESGFRVVNVAVTQGSNRDRQDARLAELRAACAYLDFDCLQTAPRGFERVSPKTRQQDPAAWAPMVKGIAEIIRHQQPRVVLFPHDADWNSTHVGVHHLVADALLSLGASWEGYTVETEFWGQMNDPNLMVEISTQDLADLMAAISFHVGEVRRNPYHLSLPAWMQDNTRRGGELVGGQGGAAPDFTFATLYRLRRWAGSQFHRFYTGGQNLPSANPPASLFP